MAHPAPSVLHDYIITLTPRLFTLVAYLRVSPELVPEVYRQIDTDGDGNTSPQERSAWVQNHVTTLRISLDDTELHTEYDLPPSLDRQTFLLSITQPVVVTYTARLDNTLQDKHRIRLVYGDNYLSYDEYYISVAGDPTNDPQPVNVSKQKYPATYQIVYHIPPVDSSGPLPSGRIAPPPFTGPQPSAGLSTQQGSGSLNSDNSQNIGTQPTALGAPGPLTSILENVRGWRGDMGLAVGWLVLALGLGALHALTPGHGKAMVAAYLIGSQGRTRDAVLLGGIVTFTHTAGVIALGLGLVLLSNFSVPPSLQPMLELASGLLVVALGLRLLVARWREAQTQAAHCTDPPAPAQAYHTHHAHAHTHTHAYAHVQHHPDRHMHRQAGSRAGANLGTVIGLGVSGGLVPCPEALIVLILAASAGQFALGLGLVGAFSTGLAAVLIATGIVLVKARNLLERTHSAKLIANPLWTRWVPLASALVVVVVGATMVLGALAARWS